jgi:hypothetical protein
MVSWVLLLLVLARRHAKVAEAGWKLAGVGAAVALLITAACLTTPFGTVLLYVTLTTTWLFTGAVMRHLNASSKSVPDLAEVRSRHRLR